MDSVAAMDFAAVTALAALPDAEPTAEGHAVTQAAESVGEHLQPAVDSAEVELAVDSVEEELAVDSVAADMGAAADTAKIDLRD
jgi:hypothetical protein